MRKLTILAVALVFALVAAPAFASVQNVRVRGSLDNTGIIRDNMDLGFGNGTPGDRNDRHQNVLISQVRVQVDADMTDNVSTTVAILNEREWSTNPTSSDKTGVDINLAYVTLREMLYSPLTVIVGRQVFKYGNSFIIDATGANNVAPSDSGLSSVANDFTWQTAQDAVRLVFDYNPLTLEFLYSKINENTPTGNEDDDDDINLWGADALYELGDDMNTLVETYFFTKKDKSPNNLGGASQALEGAKKDVVYVPGIRVSTNPIEGLNLQGEFAMQRGNKVGTTTVTNDPGPVNMKREAYGAQMIASYQVPVVEEYHPVAQYVYTYVSGDSNPSDTGTDNQASTNRWTMWDPMFEAQGTGQIWNALFDLSGAHIHQAQLSANPMEDVTTTVRWTGIWLDKELGKTPSGSLDSITIRQPDQGALSLLGKAGEEEIGHEFDAEVVYDYTEDVRLGASLGWFLPGDVFSEHNDSVATQAIVHGNVNF